MAERVGERKNMREEKREGRGRAVEAVRWLEEGLHTSGDRIRQNMGPSTPLFYFMTFK